MIVNATRMLQAAKKGHYAVGHFNTNNLEWTKAILLTAQKLNSPVIIATSMGAAKYMGGYAVVAAMVKAMDKALGITVPVALHLDHGNYEAAKACVEAGYSSIMFDGSSLPFEENVEKTTELVKLAHDHGMSIEAEVGAIGGTEDGITADGEVADPEECKKIVDLGVDFLAAGIGNIHGIYPVDWKGLHFDALDKINKATNYIPLVLHGGTGIPDDQIVHAIHDGVSKINVNTDCQLVFAQATIDYCAAGKADPTAENKEKGYDPRKLLKPGYQAICDKVEEKIRLFGSVDKANY
ncbi:MAG: class II fructose-1,6-bisphosphate aldolase [Candidatus Enterosoma sp.]|nr:class II fructose-1,6-bisphosphate aldolase [Bacilli bacterium]MDD7180937.1 class II fructose-1,6-bisphosphate aldolase [Bacilli bacterium]MDY3046852.1 class II fructose-1,6-bisphosphate aldolase [Candidatus Enterosoma sp.]